MMKALLQSSLLIYLLSILVNVTFAEETSLNNQRVKNISSSPVAAQSESVSPQSVIEDNKDAKSYHLPGMPYYKKVKKYYWAYFDSEEPDTDADNRLYEGNTLQFDKTDLNLKRPRRLEASYSFDYLNPNDPYGDWHSGQLSFYNTVSPGFTYFIQGVGLNRKEGTGATGTVGAYKGWTSFLYTCTSVTAGTNEIYLPKFRFDHDFNFNVWPGKRINFLTGLSYIDYYDDHSGWVFSGGPMISFDKLILHYRLFYNISNPGTISSFSHLVSIGYGQEGWQWTYLNVSFGKQAYLAAFVAPQEVNQNSFSVNLRHRHWVDKYYGIFGDVSYTKLEDGYDKYGIGLGAFYEF